MKQAGPPGWQDKARELLAEKRLNRAQIAEAVGVSITTLYRVVINPDYGARQRRLTSRLAKTRGDTGVARRREWRLRKLATDPSYRIVERERSKRGRLRRAAREEAAETGVPVEQVYERWGVA